MNDKLARAKLIAASAAPRASARQAYASLNLYAEQARMADARAAGILAVNGFVRTARVIALPHIRLKKMGSA